VLNLYAQVLKAGLVRTFKNDLLPASTQCQLTGTEDSMNTRFQFRLNGLVITRIVVRPVLIGGTTDRWELVANHEKLGEFAISDGEDDLLDPALPRFILEVRDVTIPPIERRFLPNKGWRRVTTTECLELLESAGVIERF
jgi:hypothetical protein